MDPYFQTFLGVAVSVGLFLIGYRQTLGARKERIRTANTDIEKTLLKRLALESYIPSVSDVTRLIDGKARDYRVRTRDLLSETQTLNTLFTRVIESDFIGHEQREQILKRLTYVLSEAEETPAKEAEVIALEPSRKRKFYIAVSYIMLPIGISIIGALLTTMLNYYQTEDLFTIDYLTVFTVFGVSLVLITTILITYRLRESLEEPGASQALETAIDFEREVGKTLKKFGVPMSLGPVDRGYDFSTEINGARIIIEVKAWSKMVPISFLQRSIGQLQKALKSEEADEALIVTKDTIDFPSDIIKDTGVKIMTLRELRNYLAHRKV